MTTYTVHHPAETAPQILHRSEETEFVKDGFCWPALFVPILWLLYRRLWLVWLAYIGFVLILGLIGELASLSEDLVTVIATGANVLLGFEGNNLRRWTLHRHGFLDHGVVIARPLIEAERRFFQALIERHEPATDPGVPPDDPARKPIRIAGPLSDPPEMEGLFPAPGVRA